MVERVIFRQLALIRPKTLEPRGIELSVTNRMLNIPMSQIILYRPGILS